MQQTPIAEILIVEDSPTDLLLAREALKSARSQNRVHAVSDGIEALAFLRGEGRFVGKPRPDLVLLDLNLPRKSGREVLAEVKADPALSSIPIVVLTTSTMREDIASAYALHANCLIVKPVDFESFRQVVQSVGDFWFSIVKLPPSNEDEADV